MPRRNKAKKSFNHRWLLGDLLLLLLFSLFFCSHFSVSCSYSLSICHPSISLSRSFSVLCWFQSCSLSFFRLFRNFSLSSLWDGRNLSPSITPTVHFIPFLVAPVPGTVPFFAQIVSGNYRFQFVFHCLPLIRMPCVSLAPTHQTGPYRCNAPEPPSKQQHNARGKKKFINKREKLRRVRMIAHCLRC